jgi:hypothetical protein
MIIKKIIIEFQPTISKVEQVYIKCIFNWIPLCSKKYTENLSLNINIVSFFLLVYVFGLVTSKAARSYVMLRTSIFLFFWVVSFFWAIGMATPKNGLKSLFYAYLCRFFPLFIIWQLSWLTLCVFITYIYI